MGNKGKMESKAVLFLLILAFFCVFLPRYAMGDEYVLGPGDTIQITLWSEPVQTYTLIIDPNGQIGFPIINEVMASGMTLAQLTEDLIQRYSLYIRNPRIMITLVRPRTDVIQVLGDVRSPGAFSLPPGTTLTEAILRAGGLNETADLTAVTVQNRSGGELLITIDLSGIINGNFSKNMILKDGDIVFVPCGALTVAVIGEVNRPGVLRIKKGGGLLEAIIAAGGPTERAITSRVTVYDVNDFEGDSGKVKPLFKGNMLKNRPLENGQVVFVPRSYFWDIGIVIDILSGLNLIKTLVGL